MVLIIGPFFSGHLRPEDTVKGRAAMLSNMRYHTSVIISLFRCTVARASLASACSGGKGRGDGDLRLAERVLWFNRAMQLPAPPLQKDGEWSGATACAVSDAAAALRDHTAAA